MPTSQIPVPTATTSRLRPRPSVPALKFPKSDPADDVNERGSYFDKYPKRAEQLATPPAPSSSNSSRPMTSPVSPRRVRSGTTPKVREKSKDRAANTEPFPSVARSSTTRSRTRVKESSGSSVDAHESYAWPSKPTSSSSENHSTHTGDSRRTRYKSSSPSRASSYTNTLPELRYSASTIDPSSFSPPHTPVGHLPSFPNDNVGIAAPIGVETMDALVAGMNGDFGDHSSSGEQDFLGTMLRTRRGRAISTGKRFINPLYQPPLPTPPSGVKIGIHPSPPSSTSDHESAPQRPPRGTRPRTRTGSSTTSSRPPTTRTPTAPRPPSCRTITEKTLRKGHSYTQLRTEASERTPEQDMSPTNPSISQVLQGAIARPGSAPKVRSAALTIDEIIRQHSPGLRHPASLRPLTVSLEESEDTATSRSSIDSITLEATEALKSAPATPGTVKPLHHAKSFPTRPAGVDSTTPDSRPPSWVGSISVYSSPQRYGPPSDCAPDGCLDPKGIYATSVYSFSSAADTTSPIFGTAQPNDCATAVAQYLRSPRLTRLITLRRPPHRGLTVSLADVGSPTGLPVVVFLGLGCVRYLIALYEEMAEALGLRLIAIDRWGMGRTGDVDTEKRGMQAWAAICEEVLDIMGIGEVGVMAHSAGAPYSLAFALRVGTRVRGAVHLLAPWAGGGIEAVGYKWLKYVPNSFIKAAQNAEWKVQGWKLGKPPTIVYEGISNDPKAAAKSIAASPTAQNMDTNKLTRAFSSPSSGTVNHLDVPSGRASSTGRQSFQFSDYDDLADFNGRFGSTTTLAKIAADSVPPVPPVPAMFQSANAKRKMPKSLFGILKGPSPSSSAGNTPVISVKSPKLKGLKSMSSLKGGKKDKPTVSIVGTTATGAFDVGEGIKLRGVGTSMTDPIEEWGRNVALAVENQPDTPPATLTAFQTRNRSLSFTSAKASSLHGLGLGPVTNGGLQAPFASQRSHHSPGSASSHKGATPSPPTSIYSSQTPTKPFATTLAPTSNIATALLRASHKEAQKGISNDLLSILERDNRPWGFSYADVKHPVKLWYGSKDEKIPETGIRWMERVMLACEVKICAGKDHGLMVCADVVVEVLESLQSQLREDERRRKREEREKKKEGERRRQEEEQRRTVRSGHYSNYQSRRER